MSADSNTPSMRYRTIVADPPWDHSDGTGVDIRSGRVTHLPYSTMSVSEIAVLPVGDLALPEAHLYLWTTSRFLPAAFQICEVWGFSYAATLVWCKAARGWSVGGKFQNNVEFVLFCRDSWRTVEITSYLADRAAELGISTRQVNREMGTSDMAGWWLSRLPHRCRIPTDEQWQALKALLQLDSRHDETVRLVNEGRGLAQGSTTRWWTWDRGEHSAKPEAFLDVVESVSLPPRVELFARRQRLGWDTWGNEALKHVEISA